MRHASRSRPPREWLRSRRGPWRGAVLADILERGTCRSAARGATLGLLQRHSKLCNHWESPLRRPSVRRHSQFPRAEHLRSHPWVRGVHRRHLGSRRRAPRAAQREGLPLGGRAPIATPSRVQHQLSSNRPMGSSHSRARGDAMASIPSRPPRRMTPAAPTDYPTSPPAESPPLGRRGRRPPDAGAGPVRRRSTRRRRRSARRGGSTDYDAAAQA